MSLEALVHTFERHLARLGRLFCQTDPHAPLRAEIDDTATRLREIENALAGTRRRLHDRQIAIAALTAKVGEWLGQGQGERAWKAALELDRLRQALTEEQARVPRQEQMRWSLQFRLRQLERQLERALSGEARRT